MGLPDEYLTIGRALLADADRRRFNITGDTITLGGVYVPDEDGDVPAAMAARANLRALATPDLAEVLFPVQWTAAPHVEGFYTATDAKVADLSSFNDTGGFEWAVTLNRADAGGFRTPQLDVLAYASLRTNDRSIVNANIDGEWFYGIPASSASFYIAPELVYADAAHLPARDANDIAGLLGRVYPGVVDTTVENSYSLNAINYYVGAATLEANLGDGRWFPLEGRHIEGVHQSHVRVSNGIVRFTPRLGVYGADICKSFDLSRYHPTHGWDTQTYQVGRRTGGTGEPEWVALARKTAIKVLVNTPEEVVVEYLMGGTANHLYTHSMTVTIRRGWHYVLLGFSRTQQGAPLGSSGIYLNAIRHETPLTTNWTTTTSGMVFAPSAPSNFRDTGARPYISVANENDKSGAAPLPFMETEWTPSPQIASIGIAQTGGSEGLHPTTNWHHAAYAHVAYATRLVGR